MVHKLAAQLGGAFVLESQPRQGTTASLWLPATDGPVASTHDQDPSVLAGTEVLGTILLVDDEPLARVGTCMMLTDARYSVIGVAGADDALQMVLDGLKIDLLVTDFAMPRMNGAQLAAALRKHDPTLPMLMITGFGSVTEADMGGLPRLAKPFRQTELMVQVAEALSSKRT